MKVIFLLLFADFVLLVGQSLAHLPELGILIKECGLVEFNGKAAQSYLIERVIEMDNKTESQKKLSREIEQVKEVVATMEPRKAVEFLLRVIDGLEDGMMGERDLDYIRTKTKKMFQT